MGAMDSESALSVQALSVQVWRGAADGRFQTFQGPRRAHQTILDVVTEIQRDQDATLSYRFACRVGMCGSCAMVVNGRPRWTCRTRVSEAAAADGKLQLQAPPPAPGGRPPPTESGSASRSATCRW